jgi:hypothetical protein
MWKPVANLKQPFIRQGCFFLFKFSGTLIRVFCLGECSLIACCMCFSESSALWVAWFAPVFHIHFYFNSAFKLYDYYMLILILLYA